MYLTEEQIKQRAEWLRRADSCLKTFAHASGGNIFGAINAVTGDDFDALRAAITSHAADRSEALRDAARTGIPPAWERPPENTDRAQLAALAEQPAPAAGMGDIWADIIPDLPAILQPYATERRRQGIERYRTPLQPHNGRDALYDAMQEALDLVVYLRQAEMEEYRRAHLEEISGAMQHALDAAQLIAGMIERRGAK